VLTHTPSDLLLVAALVVGAPVVFGLAALLWERRRDGRGGAAS
jgi:hypothetical protein